MPVSLYLGSYCRVFQVVVLGPIAGSLGAAQLCFVRQVCWFSAKEPGGCLMTSGSLSREEIEVGFFRGRGIPRPESRNYFHPIAKFNYLLF